eukprot:GHVL01006202.1.p1 GENE.GHVL01006202.1~~GHVL01006202.1.p1  ORF type:complete len:184 (-),score=49.38 GHVL01006202.1:584-1135(-)
MIQNNKNICVYVYVYIGMYIYMYMSDLDYPVGRLIAEIEVASKDEVVRLTDPDKKRIHDLLTPPNNLSSFKTQLLEAETGLQNGLALAKQHRRNMNHIKKMERLNKNYDKDEDIEEQLLHVDPPDSRRRQQNSKKIKIDKIQKNEDSMSSDEDYCRTNSSRRSTRLSLVANNNKKKKNEKKKI